MKAFNKERRAVFRDNVDLTHFPSERHDVVLKPGDPLPEDGMHMFCEQKLEITSHSEIRKDARGRSSTSGRKWLAKATSMSERRTYRLGNTGYLQRRERAFDFLRRRSKTNPGDPDEGHRQRAGGRKYQGEQIKYWTKTKNIEVIGGLGGMGN